MDLFHPSSINSSFHLLVQHVFNARADHRGIIKSFLRYLLRRYAAVVNQSGPSDISLKIYEDAQFRICAIFEFDDLSVCFKTDKDLSENFCTVSHMAVIANDEILFCANVSMIAGSAFVSYSDAELTLVTRMKMIEWREDGSFSSADFDPPKTSSIEGPTDFSNIHLANFLGELGNQLPITEEELRRRTLRTSHVFTKHSLPGGEKEWKMELCPYSFGRTLIIDDCLVGHKDQSPFDIDSFVVEYAGSPRAVESFCVSSLITNTRHMYFADFYEGRTVVVAGKVVTTRKRGGGFVSTFTGNVDVDNYNDDPKTYDIVATEPVPSIFSVQSLYDSYETIKLVDKNYAPGKTATYVIRSNEIDDDDDESKIEGGLLPLFPDHDDPKRFAATCTVTSNNSGGAMDIIVAKYEGSWSNYSFNATGKGHYSVEREGKMFFYDGPCSSGLLHGQGNLEIKDLETNLVVGRYCGPFVRGRRHGIFLGVEEMIVPVSDEARHFARDDDGSLSQLMIHYDDVTYKKGVKHGLATFTDGEAGRVRVLYENGKMTGQAYIATPPPGSKSRKAPCFVRRVKRQRRLVQYLEENANNIEVADQSCINCTSKNVDAVYVPCGHKVSCSDCASSHCSGTYQCSECSQVVKSFVTLH